MSENAGIDYDFLFLGFAASTSNVDIKKAQVKLLLASGRSRDHCAERRRIKKRNTPICEPSKLESLDHSAR
jgi:hypothetical protein